MSLTVRELDRLVSKTELDPTTKLLLRHVRKAVINGRAGVAEVREYSWTVPVEGDGTPFRFQFRMRRERRG